MIIRMEATATATTDLSRKSRPIDGSTLLMLAVWMSAPGNFSLSAVLTAICWSGVTPDLELRVIT